MDDTDRQLVYRRRLLRAHGARARLRARGDTIGPPITGVWNVAEGGRFFLQADPPSLEELSALAAGPWGACAEVQLDLPSGVHSFVAIIRRAREAHAWEVVPHPRIEVHEARAHVRISGPLDALLDRRDGSAWEPAVLDDVAINGVAFRCRCALAPGTQVALRLGPGPFGPLPALPIEIVRTVPAIDGSQCYGARFIDLDPSSIERLVDLLIHAKAVRRLRAGG